MKYVTLTIRFSVPSYFVRNLGGKRKAIKAAKDILDRYFTPEYVQEYEEEDYVERAQLSHESSQTDGE
jgi:hypothetical protein